MSLSWLSDRNISLYPQSHTGDLQGPRYRGLYLLTMIPVITLDFALGDESKRFNFCPEGANDLVKGKDFHETLEDLFKTIPI